MQATDNTKRAVYVPCSLSTPKKESKILLSALNEYFPSALGAGHWRLVQVSICKFQDTVISPRKMEGLQLQHLASRYLIKFTRS